MAMRNKNANDRDHEIHFIRENASLIIETFMEKYIYNTIEHEIQLDSDRHEEENKGNNLMSDEGTARNQMRGFELIMKIFGHITIQDWLKVQSGMNKKYNYHF